MQIDPQQVAHLEQKAITTNENIVRLQEQVKALERMVSELVSKTEFAPVKLIAYGLATAVLSSVIMAVLAKVLIK